MKRMKKEKIFTTNAAIFHMCKTAHSNEIKNGINVCLGINLIYDACLTTDLDPKIVSTLPVA